MSSLNINWVEIPFGDYLDLLDKRNYSQSGNDWCGPLDPLVILCPYELMGSCQDEECNFQHQPNNSTT